MPSMSSTPSRTGGFKVAIVSTGGTIEKTYDELGGSLSNEYNVLDVLLSQLELEGVEIRRISLMNKDSLDMSEADMALVATTVEHVLAENDGVVVVHGTDRLADTGHLIHERLGETDKPVVLTGAMRPYELRQSDAVQNMTEALIAVQLLAGGVWCVLHNKAMRFPGVRKDRERLTLVRD